MNKRTAEHSVENCEKLADTIVENMELDDLIKYATEQMTEYLVKDEESFHTDWYDMGMENNE